MISISSKNIDLTGPLEVFINDKLGALSKYLKGLDSFEIKVEVGRPSRHHHKGNVYYAEASVLIGKTLLRAEATHEDIRSAITKVKDELQLQLSKFKDKKQDISRKPKK